MSVKPARISFSYRSIKPDGNVVPESGEFIELGRKFRKNPTNAEKFLWQYLRNRQMDGEIYNLPHVKEHNIGG